MTKTKIFSVAILFLVSSSSLVSTNSADTNTVMHPRYKSASMAYQVSQEATTATGDPVFLAGPLATPPDPTADIPWSAGYSGVTDIRNAFNNARTTENSQLGTSIPSLTMPPQSEWDSMTNGGKALWLINRERIDRGVAPLHRIESNVTSVAQYYAQYLIDNNAFSHNADGRSPWQRLSDNPAIGVCQDWLPIAENLAVFWTSGSSISLPVERSVYMWMYDDSSSSWGHRHAILYYPYSDNSSLTGREGFLGIGRANGPHFGWNYAEMIVMNVFDPCSSWQYWLKFGWNNPESLASGDMAGDGKEEILGDFGASGLWYYNGWTWNQFSWSNPQAIVSANMNGVGKDEVVGDFGWNGLWYYNGSTWTKFSYNNPESIAAGDIDGDGADEVIGDFGASGVWRYDVGTWTRIAWNNPQGMITADMNGDGRYEIVADFGSAGLWYYSTGSGTWTQFGATNPQGISAGDIDGDGQDEIIGDFGSLGSWYYNPGLWSRFGWTNPEVLTAGDIDGDSVDEVVGDFGSTGIWVYDSWTWKNLSWTNPQGLIVAKLKGDATADIIGDFGSLGLWYW